MIFQLCVQHGINLQGLCLNLRRISLINCYCAIRNLAILCWLITQWWIMSYMCEENRKWIIFFWHPRQVCHVPVVVPLVLLFRRDSMFGVKKALMFCIFFCTRHTRGRSQDVKNGKRSVELTVEISKQKKKKLKKIKKAMGIMQKCAYLARGKVAGDSEEFSFPLWSGHCKLDCNWILVHLGEDLWDDDCYYHCRMH